MAGEQFKDNRAQGVVLAHLIQRKDVKKPKVKSLHKKSQKRNVKKEDYVLSTVHLTGTGWRKNVHQKKGNLPSLNFGAC